MREFDDAALELQLRGVLRERLGGLPLDLDVATLERRRRERELARRRRRTMLGLGLAAALVLPAGWLVAGGWRQPPDRTAVVVAPTSPPDSAPAATDAAPCADADADGRNGARRPRGVHGLAAASGRRGDLHRGRLVGVLHGDPAVDLEAGRHGGAPVRH